MYRRILLASDGAPESLVALREGALLAKSERADVHLLIVSAFRAMATEIGEFLPRTEDPQAMLDRGLSRLRAIGVRATGSVAQGDPIQAIVPAATSFRADLVIVGHRKQSLIDRWWAGSSGAYLADHLRCSLLLARHVVSDEAFERIARSSEALSPGESADATPPSRRRP